MIRTPITPDFSLFPEPFHFLLDCPVYDSSCSKEARVLYLGRDGGLFVKSAPKGTLKTEAEMDAFFHSKGLGPEVLHYLSLDQDWLLTRAIPGEDCTHPDYLRDPKQLCDTTAMLLRRLHEENPSGCPVNRRETYIASARRNYAAGKFDPDLFPKGWGFSAKEEAWQEIETNAAFLKGDVLLHGDYCLPNIMLDHWQFSGFLDLDCGGLGDRHIDLFWGLWSLNYNLKTNDYYDRFLDVYGRDVLIPEKLRTVAALECFL